MYSAAQLLLLLVCLASTRALVPPPEVATSSDDCREVPYGVIHKAIESCRAQMAAPTTSTYEQRCDQVEHVMKCVYERVMEDLPTCTPDSSVGGAFRHTMHACWFEDDGMRDLLNVMPALCAELEKSYRIHPCQDPKTNCPDGEMCGEYYVREDDVVQAVCNTPIGCPNLTCGPECETHNIDPETGCPVCDCICEKPTCEMPPCIDGPRKDSRGCTTCECASGLPSFDCEPVSCERKCQYYTQDVYGCDTCECQCEPRCCTNDCEHGFLRDEQGCPTCGCAEPPAVIVKKKKVPTATLR